MCACRERHSHITPYSPVRKGKTVRLEKISPVEGEELAKAWGFPRRVSLQELESGHWFRYRDRMVTWLEPTPISNFWAPHLVVNPSWRRKPWPVLKCWIELLAMTYGWSQPGPVRMVAIAEPEDAPLCDFFARLGFTEVRDSPGVFFLQYDGEVIRG